MYVCFMVKVYPSFKEDPVLCFHIIKVPFNKFVFSLNFIILILQIS